MKIQDIRIGMEVKSSGNSYCTYFVGQIGPGDNVRVKFDKRSQGWGTVSNSESTYLVFPSQLSPVKATRKAKVPAAPSIESRILKILEKGTRIVRFEYNGKLRNVLIGKNIDEPRWGKVENRAILSHNGRKYLLAVDNNDAHTVKNFALDNIQNPSF